MKMTYTFFSTTAKRCRHDVYKRHPAAERGTAGPVMDAIVSEHGGEGCMQM